MMRRIHRGLTALTLASLGACSRGQEARNAPQQTRAPEQATLAAPEQETLLEVVPPGTRNLLRLKVADAATLPLMQGLLAELGQMPQIAQRSTQIERSCGENPLGSIDELLVFGTGEPMQQGQGEQAQGELAQRVRSAEMVVQLTRPTSWAFQCLGALRDDVRKTEIQGRAARRTGEFVTIDVGGNRLLVTRSDGAEEALQRLTAAEEEEPHRAVGRTERLGDPLIFSLGTFENQLGLEVAETILIQDGDAVQLHVTGDMQDEQAAQVAAERLKRGLSLAEALIGERQQERGQQSPQGPSGSRTEEGIEQPNPRGVQGGTTPDGGFIARGAASQGATETAEGATDLQQVLRALVDNARVERRGDMVRVSLNMPDADTQRFIGTALGRFLVEGGPQRLMERREQLEQRLEQREGEQQPMPPSQGDRPDN